ncbi:type II CRISPR RNA-guided endonuclease Cas9 [Lactococcus protaetiae]|uniref:CRISPR-associated endonuclease Cas9 n=1 Tax=Lactococcus protaetiae TaxID=2592653 RepID=A0A514Z9E9_9LACT|nr:type II CRISPR RNA-guided endonuclease Cas9 [Lactococcus protaetiae]QDK71203.1 type II CRISPR RNA-guided endonuclease Cas9 [Lactococcus protaetiae]
MTKYSVGLDIGIASVGWSIVDIEKKKIVDLGSRIFPSGNAAGNQERRGFRGTRRLIRRRKNRLSDLTKLLTKNGFTVNTDKNQNPYALRVSGLTEQLSKEELAAALYHIVNRRGISYDLGDLEDDGKSGVSDYKSSININRQLLREKTVGQIQLERLNEYSQVRGQVKADDEKTLLNVFPSSAYADEAKRILEKQAEFYPEITDEFIEKLIGLVTRKREYFHGPGSEKWPTPYGRYRLEQGKLIFVGENLYEYLIGEDNIGTKIAGGIKQKRASASSLTAQIYNLLNDLNNLTVPNAEDGKLTTETKKEILSAAKSADGQFGKVQICKLIGVKFDELKTKKGGEIEFKHTLFAYRKFRKALAEINIEANDLPTEFFDKIADILTLNNEKAEIRKQLDKADFAISDEVKELIVNKNKEFLVDGRATWHSFSYKTLNLLIPELLNTHDEQMTILTRLGLMKPDNEKYKGLKNIPALQITEEIYNPVVAKSTRESINVFNAIAKRVGRENIEHVVIELPREDNEEEARKNIVKMQKQNESEKAEADNEILQQLPSSVSNSELLLKYRQIRGLSQKVRYWYQQENICPYCGKKIKAIDLIDNNESFEIDHIIPISVSYDDAQNNKVLVHSQCNQEKAQQTPLGWINNGGGFGQSKAEYIAKVKANKRYSKNKRDNLLNDADLNDIITRRSFIQRNLNDTRYASRVVLDEFYSFFKSNNLPTKVKVVRGKWTSQMRKKWNGVGGLAKTRDTHHHHAIDASIIASFPLLKAFDKAVKLIDIDKETGEILQDREAVKKAREAEVLKQWAVIKNKDFERLVDELYDFPLFKDVELANDIDNPENPVKFSHRVDKKANRAVANQTIYGTRQKQSVQIQGRGKNKREVEISEEYIFGTIKNIYNVEDFAKFKKLYDEANKKGDTKFLMQEKDPRTWEKLIEIMKDYPDFEEKTQVDGKVKVMPISPFEFYRRDNGFITKYAKHNNGPKVVSLKYYDSKVGSHIDITPRNAKNKVVLQSLKPWRTDVYFNPDTEQYELLGLKYSDLKFTQGVYGIIADAYERLKHGVEADGTILWKPIGQKSEFCFSLYRNDRVKIVDDKGEEIELLFGSRAGNNEGYVEMKPVHKARFEGTEEVSFYGKTSSGRFLKPLAKKGYKLYKVNTDILGTPHYTEKESDQPKLNL